MRRLFIILLLAACQERPLGSIETNRQPLCQFDAPADPQRAVLAVLAENQLRFVDADGSARAVHTFSGDISAQALVSRGHFVAASAWVRDNQTEGHTEMLLLEDGQLRWQASRPGSFYVQAYLNDHGALALSLSEESLVVDAAGQERDLAGLQPIADPLDDGSLLLRGPWQAEGVPGEVGWLRSGANLLEPLARTPADGFSAPIVVAGRAVYVTADATLVSERPSDVRTVDLPGLDAESSYIGDHVDSGWLLIGGFREPRYRVNVRTLEAEPIGLHTPEGLRAFQGAIYGPRLDSEGALLAGLRDDYSGALYRGNGTQWTRLGGTVTNVLDIYAIEHGGTYLIDATSGRYSTEEWSPAPPDQRPDYDGDSLQVLRNGRHRQLGTAARFLELESLNLSSDGRCLAWWTYDDTSASSALTVYDVEGDQLYDLAQSAQAGVATWLE